MSEHIFSTSVVNALYIITRLYGNFTPSRQILRKEEIKKVADEIKAITEQTKYPARYNVAAAKEKATTLQTLLDKAIRGEKVC